MFSISEHKCNPDNPYEICSVRGSNGNKTSTGVGDYVITNNDMISETERAARREKCRKQWQISPEALKSISNSYPKVSNPSASSITSREGRVGGGQNRRNHLTNAKQSVGQNNSSASGHNSNRKLPPIERSVESQNFDSNNISISRTESHQKRSISTNEIVTEKSKEISSINYNREGTESSCSQIMESQHREATLGRIDASVREDHSISCEPEWIVSRPTKAKPTDNLKWEGPMELETTFKSTIDSSAAQRLIASRQGDGEHGTIASPMNIGAGDPTVPFKRRHRPKTSLKLGGEGSYSTINRESYKNFVVVDQSREQLVQDRLDALARSMDERQKLMEQQGSGSNRNQIKSKSKRSTDIQPTPTRSSATDQYNHKVIVASKSKVSSEQKSHQTEVNEHQSKIITKSKVNHNDENNTTKKQSFQGAVEVTKSTKSNQQKTIKDNGQNRHEKMTIENEGKNINTIVESDNHTNGNADKSSYRKVEINSRNENGHGSRNKSPIPSKSGGTVPFAVPIVRPSPIRPTSSLTLNCKFKGDRVMSTSEVDSNESNSKSDEINSSNHLITTKENVTMEKESEHKNRKDHYTIYEESLKVERDRMKSSKSNPALNNMNDQQNKMNEDERDQMKREDKNASKQKRARSLPRHRGSRDRNESHLKFDGNMDFETTTHHDYHDYQDGSQVNAYFHESRSIGQRKPYRDLFRTSSEAELMTSVKTIQENRTMNKANSKSTNTMTTTYNSVFRNKLYCPVIDLTPKNPEFQYKGEAGGHHFFQPLFFTST